MLSINDTKLISAIASLIISAIFIIIVVISFIDAHNNVDHTKCDSSDKCKKEFTASEFLSILVDIIGAIVIIMNGILIFKSNGGDLSYTDRIPSILLFLCILVLLSTRGNNVAFIITTSLSVLLFIFHIILTGKYNPEKLEYLLGKYLILAFFIAGLYFLFHNFSKFKHGLILSLFFAILTFIITLFTLFNPIISAPASKLVTDTSNKLTENSVKISNTVIYNIINVLK